jgi:hypothetical protein
VPNQFVEIPESSADNRLRMASGREGATGACSASFVLTPPGTSARRQPEERRARRLRAAMDQMALRDGAHSPEGFGKVGASPVDCRMRRTSMGVAPRIPAGSNCPRDLCCNPRLDLLFAKRSVKPSDKQFTRGNPLVWVSNGKRASGVWLRKSMPPPHSRDQSCRRLLMSARSDEGEPPREIAVENGWSVPVSWVLFGSLGLFVKLHVKIEALGSLA